MDAGPSQPEEQQDGEQQAFSVLDLPRPALVAILTAARSAVRYRQSGLLNVSCSCQQLNVLVSPTSMDGREHMHQCQLSGYPEPQKGPA
jgi:hypothetical protein